MTTQSDLLQMAVEALEQSFDFPAEVFATAENDTFTMTVTGRHLRMVKDAIAAIRAAQQPTWMSSFKAAQQLAVRFHEAYERLAPSFGYTTRPETRTLDLQSANGRLMVAVCQELLTSNRAAIGDTTARSGDVGASDLPPLPRAVVDEHNLQGGRLLYTATQMREYALAAMKGAKS